MSKRDRQTIDKSQQRMVEPSGNASQLAISALIAAHFFALLVALSSNFGRSLLQGEMMAWLAPYLITTHQAYGSVALELTHDQPFDRDLMIELRVADQPWQPLSELSPMPLEAAPGWRELSRALQIVLEDDPETELLAEVAARILRKLPSSGARLQGIRLVSPRVLTFDEDAALAAGQDEWFDGELSGDILFQAEVIYDGDFLVGLLPKKDAYRESASVGGVDGP